MTPVRVAQIGVAQPHAKGFRETLGLMPDVEVVEGFDIDLEAARAALAAESSGLPLYDDVGALLERERTEAVLISLPAALTPGAIIQASAAGCHVYAEKPCARTADEFRPAMAAIEHAGVQFATGYLRHFSPVAGAMREIIEEGLLGRLVSAEARLVTTSVATRNPKHWLFRREMSGGGVLTWLGCHWLDLLRFTTGSEVDTVAAVLGTCSGESIDVEDVAAVSLRYTNGMLGTVHCAYITDRGIDQSLYVGLRGTLGWMEWDGVGPELRVRSTHPAWQTAPTRVLRFEADDVPGYGGAMGLVAMRRFFDSFRAGGPPAFLPIDALRVLEALDAARESSRTGRHVQIENRSA